MIQEIPLQAVPAQTISIMLSGQYCKLNVYQKTTGVFIDLFVDDAPVILARVCRDRKNILDREYFGFAGDLQFVDIGGLSDPDYTGIGTRYLLGYVT